MAAPALSLRTKSMLSGRDQHRSMAEVFAGITGPSSADRSARCDIHHTLWPCSPRVMRPAA